MPGRLKILFVDADPLQRSIYTVFFPTHGYEVATATDGIDCMGKLRSVNPDVLVLEQDFPWGGCEGVLARIREDPQLCQIPLLIVTSEITDLSVHIPDNALHLSRPFHLLDMAAALRLLVGRIPVQTSTSEVALPVTS